MSERGSVQDRAPTALKSASPALQSERVLSAAPSNSNGRHSQAMDLEPITTYPQPAPYTSCVESDVILLDQAEGLGDTDKNHDLEEHYGPWARITFNPSQERAERRPSSGSVVDAAHAPPLVTSSRRGILPVNNCGLCKKHIRLVTIFFGGVLTILTVLSLAVGLEVKKFLQTAPAWRSLRDEEYLLVEIELMLRLLVSTYVLFSCIRLVWNIGMTFIGIHATL